MDEHAHEILREIGSKDHVTRRTVTERTGEKRERLEREQRALQETQQRRVAETSVQTPIPRALIRTIQPTIPHKVMPRLRIRTPDLKMHLMLIEAELPIPAPIKLPTLKRRYMDIRVPTLPPLPIQGGVLLPPLISIRAEAGRDISIRPLIQAALIEVPEKVYLSPRLRVVKIPRPSIISYPFEPKPLRLELRIKIVSGVVEEQQPGGKGIRSPREEEFYDFFKQIFGIGVGEIRSSKPTIILFLDTTGDSHVKFLESICYRIYREIEGEKPVVVKTLTVDDVGRGKVWDMPRGRGIFTLELSFKSNSDPLSMYNELKKDFIHLVEALEETSAGRTGFIILATDSSEVYEMMQTDVQELKEQGRVENVFKIILSKEIPSELASLTWGFININKSGLRLFDSVFRKAKEEFERKLREVLEEDERKYTFATARGNNESYEHYGIKVFVARYLVKKLEEKEGRRFTVPEIRERIRTEERVEGHSAIADVWYKEGSMIEVYEVETLFGEGVVGIKKIQETIEKYKGVDGVKVNIVMDNLGMLLHLREVISLKQLYGDRVEFYTLNVEDKRLVPLDEFIERYEEIIGEVKLENPRNV